MIHYGKLDLLATSWVWAVNEGSPSTPELPAPSFVHIECFASLSKVANETEVTRMISRMIESKQADDNSRLR